ncbi:MAG: hypothetical protein SFY92_11660 [Verrucomicrobiae bacterium]|nr:hypothetical protein [Verrucomicrobiae bacterium]
MNTPHPPSSRSGFARIFMVYILLFLVLAGFLSYATWRYLNLIRRLEIAAANAEMFLSRVRAADREEARVIAGELKNIQSLPFPPSDDIPQIGGSRTQRLHEASRSLAMAALINRLRLLTGEDLGPDPGPWIQKYAP